MSYPRKSTRRTPPYLEKNPQHPKIHSSVGERLMSLTSAERKPNALLCRRSHHNTSNLIAVADENFASDLPQAQAEDLGARKKLVRHIKIRLSFPQGFHEVRAPY
jgi:hypothetical protein